MGKMAEMQRRLLEQMMGPEAMGISVQNHDWWSEKVCRNFLFGTCPHILFGNTKMDLGPCPKVHSDRITKQFQEAQAANPNDPRIAAFRQEHENTLYGFIEDCDRRIRMSQRKLEKTPEENRKTVDLMREIGEIELSIQGGTEEIESLGEAGKVEESMEKLKAVDALKELKADKEKELQNLNETAGASGHQKLRVCEICGAMLSVLDSDKRLADHFGGKLHLGYQELRRLLGEMAEARMQGRVYGAPAHAAAPARPNPPPFAPSGPSAAPNNAPSGPSAPSGPPPGFAPSAPPLTGRYEYPAGPNGPNGHPSSSPRTPNHGHVPPADELPVVGHGDKVKREAGELVEDVKDARGERETDRDRSRGGDERGERDRDRDRDRGERYESDRRREGRDDGERSRHRDREDRYEKYDKYDKYGDRRSSRYDDDRRDRDRDRERRYDDDRSSRRDRERSRSPSKRKLV